MFSLDVVAVVASYAAWATATAGAKPELLFSSSTRWSIASLADGQILAGCQQSLSVFSSEGKWLSIADTGATSFGLAVDADGTVFVSSYDQHLVVVRNRDATVRLRTFGFKGAGDGQLCYPRGLALHGDLVFVVDADNKRVAVFNKSGEHVRNFGNDCLRHPWGIAFSAA